MSEKSIILSVVVHIRDKIYRNNSAYSEEPFC
jgi:hypothetical protein